MALIAGINLYRRGAAVSRSDFGYPVAPGEQIWRGGIVGVNAAGQLQRIQTAGCVALAGVADQDYSNVGQASAGPAVVGRKGCWALPVTAATVSNIGANVYATDDSACQLGVPGTGYTAAIGVLVGIDNGQTYVLLAGS